MAQLRDAHTSELVADGDPLELVLLADRLGLTVGVVHKAGDVDGLELVLDDVGHMSVDAVRRTHADHVEVLEAQATDRRLDADDRAGARRRREELAKLEARAKDTARQRDTRKRLDDARARRGRG